MQDPIEPIAYHLLRQHRAVWYEWNLDDPTQEWIDHTWENCLYDAVDIFLGKDLEDEAQA